MGSFQGKECQDLLAPDLLVQGLLRLLDMRLGFRESLRVLELSSDAILGEAGK